jgi:CheY-like chemotaxis protein
METRMPIVLSVDDNDVDGALLQRAFKRTAVPAKLFTVTEGPQALSYLTGEGIYQDRDQYPLPDLILLDLKMPKMSGLEVLSWIRQQPALKKTNVLILSSSEQAEDMKRAKSSGADSYLVKPTKFEDLQKLVRLIHGDWLDKSKKTKSAIPPKARIQSEATETPVAAGAATSPPASHISSAAAAVPQQELIPG